MDGVMSRGMSLGGTALAQSETLTGTLSTLLFEEQVPDSSTDLEVVLAIDVSAVKAIHIQSDQDVTIETNDGTTPDDTIALKANKPYQWSTNDYHTFVLGTDVTSIFVTNASGATATISIIVLTDPTP